MNKPAESTPPEPESSVLFSLHELMDLEEERIHDEERGRRQARAESEKLIEARAAQERAAEEQRLVAEAEKRQQARRLAQEDTARLEAIRLAEIERARMEALQDARLRALAQAEEHEERMALIEHNTGQRRWRRLVSFSFFLSAAVLIAGALWMQETNRQVKEEGAQIERDARARELQFEQEVKRLGQEIRRLGTAETELRKQKQEELSSLRAQRDAAKERESKRGAGPLRGGGVRAPVKKLSPPKEEPKCTEGDPMCDKL